MTTHRIKFAYPEWMDQKITLTLTEIRPDAIPSLIESIAEVNENDPRLPLLKKLWDELHPDAPGAGVTSQ